MVERGEVERGREMKEKKLDSQRAQRATGSDAHGVKDGTVREEGGRGDW